MKTQVIISTTHIFIKMQSWYMYSLWLTYHCTSNAEKVEILFHYICACLPTNKVLTNADCCFGKTYICTGPHKYAKCCFRQKSAQVLTNAQTVVSVRNLHKFSQMHKLLFRKEICSGSHKCTNCCLGKKFAQVLTNAQTVVSERNLHRFSQMHKLLFRKEICTCSHK